MQTALSETDLARLGFDAAAYRAAYGDLSNLSDADALRHFARHGHAEGRDPQIDALPGILRASPDILPTVIGCAINQQSRMRGENWTPERLAGALASDVHGLRPVVVCGDSHAEAYAQPVFATHGMFPLWRQSSGGSARGLSNPNSRGGHGRAIGEFLDMIGDRADRFLHFGQVDLEFVLHFDRLKSDTYAFDFNRAHEWICETVERYVGFARSVRATPCQIFPPVLYDETLREAYANAHFAFLSDLDVDTLRRDLRRIEFPTLAQRVFLHRLFNHELRRAWGSDLPGVCDALLDGSVVDARFFNDGRDHHLRPFMVASVLAPAMAAWRAHALSPARTKHISSS